VGHVGDGNFHSMLFLLGVVGVLDGKLTDGCSDSGVW
jgi:hypothetical protein